MYRQHVKNEKSAQLSELDIKLRRVKGAQEEDEKRTEKIFQAGLENLTHDMPKVALVLFRDASSMGHQQATRFFNLLNNCEAIKSQGV